jgi:hypothetical protein
VLNAIPATAGAVNSTYITDAAVSQAKLGAGVAGNGPAFKCYLSSTVSVPANTFTKVPFNVEIFDTAGAYDSSTNYRFLPLVAGYYQINANVSFQASGGVMTVAIYKNGSAYSYGNQTINSSSVAATTVNDIVYLNGSTDYVDIYAYQGSGGAVNVFTSGQTYSWMSGFLARAA